jgi:hypothetical protein
MFLIDRNIIKNWGTILTDCYIMNSSSSSLLFLLFQILPKARIICKNVTSGIFSLIFFTIRKITSKIANKTYTFTTRNEDCRIRRGRVSLCKGLMVGGVSKAVGNGSRIEEWYPPSFPLLLIVVLYSSYIILSGLIDEPENHIEKHVDT